MVKALPINSNVPSLARFDVTAPYDEIIAVIRRDGGCIVDNFLSAEQMKWWNDAAFPLFEKRMKLGHMQNLTEAGEGFHATHTTHIRGNLGTLPEQITLVMQHPLWKHVMETFLNGEVHSMAGEQELVTRTSYILSIANGFRVAPGAGHQLLHRDQTIHSVQADANTTWCANLGCGIGGTRATARNGGTRVVPGSHLWPWDRAPTQADATSAELEVGSALFWLGSTYHGAGQNVCDEDDPDAIRVMYGVFACRDYYRAEECQQLIVPPEVCKRLPEDILRRAGWAKGAGGSGFINARDPLVELGYV